MLDFWDILWGGIGPGVVACTALWSVVRLTGNQASAWRSATVLAFLVGLWALNARGEGLVDAVSRSIRVREAKDFLPLAVLLAIVPDMMASFGKRWNLGAWLLRIALCVGLPWRLLAGSVYLPKASGVANPFNTSAWSSGEAAAWLAGIGGVLLLTWASWRSERVQHPWLRSLLVALVFLGGSVTLALSGSLTYGQLAGVLTAAAAGCLLALWLGKIERGPDAAAGPLIIAFGGVLVLAVFYAELKIVNAVLLLLALMLAGGWMFPAGKYAGVLRPAICLVLVAVAVGGAAVDFAATQAEAADNPYSQLK